MHTFYSALSASTLSLAAFTPIQAETHRDAALQFVGLGLRQGSLTPESTVNVVVADSRSPTHANGMPMVVHSFHMTLGPRDQPAPTNGDGHNDQANHHP